jgi:hypothetical protein
MSPKQQEGREHRGYQSDGRTTETKRATEREQGREDKRKRCTKEGEKEIVQKREKEGERKRERCEEISASNSSLCIVAVW